MLLRLGLLGASAAAVARAHVEWVVARSTQSKLLASQHILLDDAGDAGGPSKMRPDSYAVCEWRVPGTATDALDLEITKDTVVPAGKCFPNVFASPASLYYPYPRSSYHYDLENVVYIPEGAPNPHVSVQVTADTGSPSVTEVAYGFKDFETNGPDILYSQVPQSPGLYDVALIAYDFEEDDHGLVKSRECSTCLSITDRLRPSNAKPADCQDKPTRLYSTGALAAHKAQVGALIQFRQTATNNACSDARCDEVFVERTDLFELQRSYKFDGASAVSDPLTHWLDCLGRPLSSSERAGLAANPIQTDGSVKYADGSDTPPVCARTCTHSVSLREYFTPYSCTTDKHAKRRVCQGSVDANGEDSQKCAFSQTLALDGPTLSPTATVKLQPSAMSLGDGVKLLRDLGQVFPGANYPEPLDSSKELHFDVGCTKASPTFGSFCHDKFQVKLSDLFVLPSDVNADEAVQGLFQGGAAPPVVFWRVKNTQNGAWQRVVNGELEGEGARLSFPRFETKLIFEAYSACGKVQTVVWTVIVHRTASLVPDKWWNSLWACGSNACAVAKSDFRVCTFDFDPTSTAYKAMLDPPEEGDKDDNAPKARGRVTFNTFGRGTACRGDPDAFLTLKEAACYKYDDVCDLVDKCKGKGQFRSLSVRLQRNTNSAVASFFPAPRCDSKRAEPATVARKCNLCDAKNGCLEQAECTFASPEAPAPPPKPAADPVEVKILWHFRGFHCSWAYENAAPTPSFWLDTDAATSQIPIKKDLALTALPDAPWTALTATCSLDFVTASGAPRSVTLTKKFGIERCEEPCAADLTKRIRATCTKLAWYEDRGQTARQPAPFQACGGATVFPVSQDKTTTTTQFLDVDELTCCNGKLLDCAYSCRPFRRSLDLKRCTPAS